MIREPVTSLKGSVRTQSNSTREFGPVSPDLQVLLVRFLGETSNLDSCIYLCVVKVGIRFVLKSYDLNRTHPWAKTSAVAHRTLGLKVSINIH